MKAFAFARLSLSLCATASLASGCGSSPTSLTAGQRETSWMGPAARTSDLLYVSDSGTGQVYVYSYPSDKLVGTLTGFTSPRGECVDDSGDIFVVDYGASDIVEYKHGGTSPINTFEDPNHQPYGCVVDRRISIMAVTNYDSDDGNYGDVSVYQTFRRFPEESFTDSAIRTMFFAAFDDKGDLFVDGLDAGTTFGFAELANGAMAFTQIKLNHRFKYPGGVAWDGKNVAVGDYSNGLIYRFAIYGSSGKEVGTTRLAGATKVEQFWLEGSRVIGPNSGGADVGIWRYPAGGAALALIKGGFGTPFGAAVSRARR